MLKNVNKNAIKLKKRGLKAFWVLAFFRHFLFLDLALRLLQNLAERIHTHTPCELNLTLTLPSQKPTPLLTGEKLTPLLLLGCSPMCGNQASSGGSSSSRCPRDRRGEEARGGALNSRLICWKHFCASWTLPPPL